MFRYSGVEALGVGRWALGVGRSGGGQAPQETQRLDASTPQRRASHRSGFTLIEVLVVMIILAILAAIVVPRVVGREEDARRARAVSDVESFGTALDMYKADNGDYPTTEEGLAALRTQPASAKNWNGPYLKKPLEADPWGNAYVYVCPGEHNPDSYDLSSYGADGQPGGEGKNADVNNWDEQEQK